MATQKKQENHFVLVFAEVISSAGNTLLGTTVSVMSGFKAGPQNFVVFILFSASSTRERPMVKPLHHNPHNHAAT